MGWSTSSLPQRCQSFRTFFIFDNIVPILDPFREIISIRNTKGSRLKRVATGSVSKYIRQVYLHIFQNILLENVNIDLKVSTWVKCFELLRGLERCKHSTTTIRGVQLAYSWRDISKFMLEKFLILTPNLSKLFLIFDTSGETMCSFITNRERSTFLNLQRT